MLHLKAVRIFVESVLRYGLTTSLRNPGRPNFVSFLVQPKKGKTEMLRKELAAIYGGGSAINISEGDEETVVPGATGEFFPYVCTAIEAEPNVAS
jgi:hypothetical protein